MPIVAPIDSEISTAATETMTATAGAVKQAAEDILAGAVCAEEVGSADAGAAVSQVLLVVLVDKARVVTKHVREVGDRLAKASGGGDLVYARRKEVADDQREDNDQAAEGTKRLFARK